MELLVVIAIILILIALLMPAMRSVWSQARAVQCAANMRQLGIALIAYAQENRGSFPPNTASPTPGQFWYDPERIGRFLSSTPYADTLLRSQVLTCGEEPDAFRSYAMNIWASSKVDPFIKINEPSRGRFWKLPVRNPSRMILMGERYATVSYGDIGWASTATIGAPSSRPGRRFGAGGGISLAGGRYGVLTCELPYFRHRFANRSGKMVTPVGRANFCYADGHVEMRSADDLADFTTGTSKLDSWWTPIDNLVNQ